MNREEVQKLLGGYATGTLTPEEQQALFAAALDDQELFDALGREQSLRDLLRDPAAKAQVLAALDTALDTARVPWYRHGWWRPAAVAAAMAGIVMLAVVLTRKPAPGPVTVAGVKATAPEQGPEAGGQQPGVTPGPEPGAPMARRARPLTLPRREQKQAAATPKDLPAPPMPVATPPPGAAAEQLAIQAASGRQVAAPAAAPQAPPPAATLPGVSAFDKVEVQAQAPQLPMAQQGQQGGQLGQLGLRDTAAGSGGALDSRLLAANARLLFYGNPAAADASLKQVSAKKTAPERARAANTVGALTTLTLVPAYHLGVRCSILRKQPGGETAEVRIETVLDAGEQVKLKLVPNDRGYLRVWELSPNDGLRSIASGTAQPLQPFEASLPDYPSAGERTLYVQFARNSQSPPLLTPPRPNIIRTGAEEPEKATYVVNRVSDPSIQQLVVPITLNYK